MPKRENVDPIRSKDLTDSDAPTLQLSKTDIEDPKREKDLRDIELPKIAMSRTDSENTEPNLAKPSKDTDEPKRAKLRTAMPEPMCE
jgi:hypothetical protein